MVPVGVAITGAEVEMIVSEPVPVVVAPKVPPMPVPVNEELTPTGVAPAGVVPDNVVLGPTGTVRVQGCIRHVSKPGAMPRKDRTIFQAVPKAPNAVRAARTTPSKLKATNPEMNKLTK